MPMTTGEQLRDKRQQCLPRQAFFEHDMPVSSIPTR